MPQLSVVIPTFNRVERLRRVIDALARQQLPQDAFEVVVVSDGSSDGTNDYLASLGPNRNVRGLVQPNRGPAAARNKGVTAATGEFVVFIDDDVEPQPQCLAEHMRLHTAAGRDVAVLGPLLSPEKFRMSPWVGWEQEKLMQQYRAMLQGKWVPTARQFYTGNASLRRQLIVDAGGFDENFRRAEDVELAYRLASRGLGFVFSMEAAGLHFAERSFASWLNAAYTYGRNDVIFGRDRGQPWLLSQVREEFGLRNALVRKLVRTCIRHKQVAPLAASTLKGLAHGADLVSTRSINSAACSGLFNLNYYQGFCDEFGDPDYLLGGR